MFKWLKSLIFEKKQHIKSDEQYVITSIDVEQPKPIIKSNYKELDCVKKIS